MSHPKYNALSLTKRPSRLMVDDTQVRKDFGGVAKRPKLDIRLTPSSSNMPPAGLVEDSFDDLWGDDMSEEAVEECLLLASQACPEANLGEVATTSLQRADAPSTSRSNVSSSRTFTDEHFKVPVQLSKPPVLNSNSFHLNSRMSSNSVSHVASKVVSKSSSNSYLENSRIIFNNCASVNVNSKYNHVNVSTSKQTTVEKSSFKTNDVNQNSVIEDNQRLQLEIKKLKDNDLSREGEVSILRTQLKQLQLQLESQRLDNIKHVDNQGQKYKDLLKEQKKELEMTNTQLQFKIMEVTTMRNHCNLLESRSKLKLKDPQPTTVHAESNMNDFDSFTESFSAPNISPRKGHHTTVGGTPIPARMGQRREAPRTEPNAKCKQDYPIPVAAQPKSLAPPREGSALGLSVNEFLFKKSTPEISWILYIRRKQSLCKSIKEAEDINTTILTLQQNDRTLENCYTAVNKLIAMDSLSSQGACPHIEKVVQECQEILCRQMHILRLLLQVQSHAERVVLNEDIAASIGTLAGDSGARLLSARQWYSDEEGVESRRALALVRCVADVSQLAADLVTATCVNLSNSEPSTSAMEIDHVDQEPASKNIDRSSKSSHSLSSRKPVNVDYSEYTRRPFGFLCLLRDVAFSISKQRRAKHFIGLLTSMVYMLKTVVSRSSIRDDGLQLACEILREVVFACPQMEVIVALFELLSVLAPYTEVMNSLCQNCESHALVEKRYINLAYFSRDSCVIQVLFRLLPTIQLSFELRMALCSHMVRWLFGIVCVPQKETVWLFSLQDKPHTTCSCKQKLTQGLVTTLYRSICDFESAMRMGDSLFCELSHIMGLGVMLLRSLLQRDELFGLYFESVEGEYQLLLSNMQKLESKLNMSLLEKECLVELLKIEEADEDEKLENEELSDEDYWERNVNIFKSLLSNKGPSCHDKPRRPRQLQGRTRKVKK